MCVKAEVKDRVREREGEREAPKYPMTHGSKKPAINQRLIIRQGRSWEALMLSNCDKMLPGRHQFRDNDSISETVV